MLSPAELLTRRLIIGATARTVATIARCGIGAIRKGESAGSAIVRPEHIRAINELEDWDERMKPVLIEKIMDTASNNMIGKRPVLFMMGDETYEAFGSWKGETRNIAELYRLAVADAYGRFMEESKAAILAELLADPYRSWLHENGAGDGYQNRVQWWIEFSSKKEWGK